MHELLGDLVASRFNELNFRPFQNAIHALEEFSVIDRLFEIVAQGWIDGWAKLGFNGHEDFLTNQSFLWKVAEPDKYGIILDFDCKHGSQSLMRPHPSNQVLTKTKGEGSPSGAASLQSQALIALGSNLGDRPGILAKALEEIAHTCGHITAVSNWFETPPEGGVADQPFLNGACLVATKLSAADLLAALMGVEQSAGRDRTVAQGNRTLDLDVILYRAPDGAYAMMSGGSLTLPHPRAHSRLFVLAPAKQIAPNWLLHEGKSIEDLHAALFASNV